MSENAVVDFGAGTGTLAEIFRSEYGVTPICVELAPSLRKILENRKFSTLTSIDELKGNATFIYTSNVLEHIENDEAAIQKLFQKLESEGRIAIYVPALPIIFSDLDTTVGHFRRYTKKELVRKVEASGFQITKCTYVDSLGVLASLLIKVIGFKNNAGLGSEKSLLIYDRLVFPISKILDFLGFKFLIGKNLLLLASKPKN